MTRNNGMRREGAKMKVRIKTSDLIKLLLGKRILIKNITYNKIVEVKKGKDNYICK